jgi:deoxycytidine triphosphate deaminase
MFLGVDKLLELVHEQKLVTNLSDRELENPEGTGFDLRLAEVFTISGRGFLGITERQTCQIESVAKFDENKKSSIMLKPNDFYLVKTIETVNVPQDLVGILKPRSTMQRMGLYLRTTQIAPGYSGELTFALKNVGPATVTIELGARIVHVMFARVDGQTSLYRGQWQGGRVTTNTKETQV